MRFQPSSCRWTHAIHSYSAHTTVIVNSTACRADFNSTAFSAFPELQFLHFSKNYAIFQSWDGLAGLSKLRHLDLSYNCLQNISDQEPLGKLVSLEILHLEFTDMVGTLPASALDNLKYLQEVDLSTNQLLDGNLPASLFTLSSYRTLECFR